MAIFTLLSSRFAQLAILALVCFVAGFIVCWRWTHRQRLFSETLAVADVANGATIEARAGLLGRAKRPVFLEGIAAPGLNDHLGPESRDNLQALAGDTIRVESETRGLLGKPLVGTCYGSTGADLAIAQLRAGLAKCESKATKPQIAAQKEAQRATRGLWATSGGSHWWHFSVAGDTIPEPKPLVPEKPTMFPLDLGTFLMVLVLTIVLTWIGWYFAQKFVTAKSPATAAAVSAAIDTSEQVAAYAALTAIRYVPAVANDPQGVTSCEYLRGICTAWKAPGKTV